MIALDAYDPVAGSRKNEISTVDVDGRKALMELAQSVLRVRDQFAPIVA
jgi:hypothetical protein